jgi:uncharacterized protein (TIGR00255 family)
MIRSMTAYANTESSSNLGVLSCEMRSVNHRYLELGIRLPEELRPLENMLRERITQKIARGKIDLSFRFKPAASAAAQTQIDDAVLAEYAKLNQRFIASFPGMTTTFADILRLPGVQLEQEAEGDVLMEAAKALLEQTMQEFIAAREREGGKLAQVMRERLQAIESILQMLRGVLPEIRAALKARLLAKLADLPMPLDPGRLEQELVMNLQKMDVDEELDRLDSHIAEARRILSLPEAVGRRLDFLLQEFNREANTLGSKSVDPKTSQAAVELKVLIEQIREQVQNLE